MPPKRVRDSDGEYPPPVEKKPRKALKPIQSTPDTHAAAKALLSRILGSPSSFTVPEDHGEAREALVLLAHYAESLQAAVTSASAVVTKTPAQLDEAAAKLKAAAASGIRNQMAWKPSCKTGGAKWTYDGVCADPAVFSTMMNSKAPISWKMKRFTIEEFELLMGSNIRKPVRYDMLRLTSDIIVRWNAVEGMFKISGSYGVKR